MAKKIQFREANIALKINIEVILECSALLEFSLKTSSSITNDINPFTAPKLTNQTIKYAHQTIKQF